MARTRRDSRDEPVSVSGTSISRVVGVLYLKSFLSEGLLVKHQELWYEDGNIILSVDNTLFKVFCGVLASECTVFADMLAVGNPDNGERIDGCPVIHLDDSVEDFENFLRVLFKGVQCVPVVISRRRTPRRLMARVLVRYQQEKCTSAGP